MKKYFFIIFIFAIILNTGCEKFTQGLVIDIELPEHEPVLTPYCFINDTDSNVMVILQKSQGALESNETGFIENATVELYKNGTLWNTIPYNSSDTTINNGVYELPMNNAFSDEGYGDTYELRVSAPDFETTTASQTMPAPVKIERLEFNDDAGASAGQFGSSQHNLKVIFDDPAGEENYYRIQVKSDFLIINPSSGDTIGTSNSYGSGPFTTNPSIESAYGGGVIITDKLFDGQKYIADLGIFQGIGVVGQDVETKVNLEVILFSITRDEYLYQKSLTTYAASSNSLFAEPTLIHTNMTNGLGVFSMISTDVEEAGFEF